MFLLSSFSFLLYPYIIFHIGLRAALQFDAANHITVSPVRFSFSLCLALMSSFMEGQTTGSHENRVQFVVSGRLMASALMEGAFSFV